MAVNWHLAFSNVTTTEYAGVSYQDYYASPAAMLQAQVAAKEYLEQRWGVGRFMGVGLDFPSCGFSSMLGMTVIEPTVDEMPYLDTRHPLITDVADADQIIIGDPKTTGLMAKRWEFYQYYQAQGYEVGFGGYGGAVISAAVEITGGAIFAGMLDNPDGAWRVLNKVLEALERLGEFDASLRGGTYTGSGYTGDDFSGLLSPTLYREFAVPCYQRIYRENTTRFMHSELLRAEHLRIARDELGITDFHGAGCKNLTLAEMHEIMGEKFWTQVTPQEMAELSPAQLDEKIKEYAGCGCHCVQLYPGRHTPERNMDAALAACQRECTGGAA